MLRRHLSVVVLVASASCAARAVADTERGLVERLAATSGLVDAESLRGDLRVELAYSGEDNFLGEDVYGALERCYLNDDAAAMLAEAAETLAAARPDLELYVHDCVRPVSVQQAMWELVKDTPQAPYVGDPTRAVKSLHNYGCAVDLTLARSGEPLDLGSPFDHFGPRSEPRREAAQLARGELTRAQVRHRMWLRLVMVSAGFRVLDNEWWHFSCAPGAEARRRYELVR